MEYLNSDIYFDTASDVIAESQLPLNFYAKTQLEGNKDLSVLSLFSGCGGMDLGFEGNFIAHRKSVNPISDFIQNHVNDNWVMLKDTRFRTIFANDILKEAKVGWVNYMKRFDYNPEIYHHASIVDLVKMHRAGTKIFPENVDVVTGGFPCQDFSVAGKRKGFNSHKDHTGKIIDNQSDTLNEETRGKLYYWMREVVDITRPKVFIAENVKGLVNLGDVKDIIQKDFATAAGDGYIVLTPQVLHAADYGVPESRERVIFIGVRKDALLPEALAALSSNEIPSEYNPYPSPTHEFSFKNDSLSPVVTVGDVFEGVKEPNESRDLAQQFYSKAKFMGTHCQGQKEIQLNKIGPTIRSEHHGNIEYRRLSAERGGANIEELKKGLEERRLTPRECALIQTFPPDFPFVIRNGYNKNRFILSASAAYKIIGNAVPPILAYNIAMRLQNIWHQLFK